jgi:thiopeptide-type bacteriocin biosynthesis protein
MSEPFKDRRPKLEPDLVPAGFFVLRTPLLPFDELLRWSREAESPSSLLQAGDAETGLATAKRALRAYLRRMIARPEVREAIFLASPSLEESLRFWEEAPEGARGQKVERALVRYFSRMASRATPFGLFAATSLGTLADQTKLDIAPQEEVRRHSRFDMDYVSALAEAVAQDAEVRHCLSFRPNSSLYRTGRRIRYVEWEMDGATRSYHLVGAPLTEYLALALESATSGARPHELAEALVRVYEDVTPAEAAAFVDELITNQVLVPDLAPAVTGGEPVDDLIGQLARLHAGQAVARGLEKANRTLREMETRGGFHAPSEYHALAQALAPMPVQPKIQHMVQVDLYRPARAALGPSVVAELASAVRLLHRISGEASESLRRFTEAYQKRYGERELPLCQVLDEDAGIGFDALWGPAESPLLADLPFPDPPSQRPWRRRDSFLLRRLGRALAPGEPEIALSPADVDRLATLHERDAGEVPPLPDSIAIMATLSARSPRALEAGQFRIWLNGGLSAPGSALLGRFCHGDARLCAHVEAHLRAEEALRPDTIYAEVTHLPEGRVGNVILRPTLRRYELPYLGRSGAPAEQQIPLTDLWVSICEGRIVLRSRRLQREIIPRLASAHNFRNRRNPGVYRFLCALQASGAATELAWDWGPLASAEHLPRVVAGRVVLSRASWRIPKERLEPFARSSSLDRHRAAQALRVALGLPRFVGLVHADNVLPIDFENALSVENFVHHAKDEEVVAVVEGVDPDELCVHGRDGRYAHEVIVLFVHRASQTRSERPRTAERAAAARCFSPGSEWLYARLYTSPGNSDAMLREVVEPLAQGARADGVVQGWSFLRHDLPVAHLRIRFRGDAARMCAALIPALHTAVLARLADGEIHRLQIDTYEREVERYGGPEGVTLAETLAEADSEAALRLLSLLEDEAPDERWLVAIRGIDQLFDDIGLTLADKHTVAERLGIALRREYRTEVLFERAVGAQFRRRRAQIEQILDRSRDEGSDHAPALAVLSERSQRLRPIGHALLELARHGRLALPLPRLAEDFAHLHVNRMIRWHWRAHALFLCEMLRRLYESQQVRLSQPKDGGNAKLS